MVAHDSLPKQLGDEAELYRTYNDTLMRQVARRVDTSSPEVVEDACSFAWAQFLRYQPDRSRNWKSWLIRTAQREVGPLQAVALGPTEAVALNFMRLRDRLLERYYHEMHPPRHRIRELDMGR